MINCFTVVHILVEQIRERENQKSMHHTLSIFTILTGSRGLTLCALRPQELRPSVWISLVGASHLLFFVLSLKRLTVISPQAEKVRICELRMGEGVCVCVFSCLSVHASACVYVGGGGSVQSQQ